jgi:hypothetical protein
MPFRKTFIKLYIELKLLKFKKSVDLRNFVKGCIFTRIRVINNYKSQGHNTTNDNLIYETTNFLLKLNNDKSIIRNEAFIQKCLKDEKLLQLLNLYLKLENKVRETTKEEFIEIYHLPKEPFVDNIGDHSIKDVKNKLKKYVRSDFERVADKSRIKLKLSVQKTLSLLTLLTTVILCGGILYNKILFYFYNVEIGMLFNLSDYVRTSIEHIPLAILGGAIALIIYFLNLVKISEHPGYFLEEKALKNKELYSKIILFIALILFIIGSYYNINFFYKYSFIPVTYLNIIVISKLTFKYIKKPIKIFPALLFISIFLSGISLKSLSDYKLNRTKNIEVIFKNDSLNNSEYKLITISSEYIFLKSSNNEVNIFNKNLIQMIKLKN